jgi:phosphoribosylformimino-5-aminoimidazole carboxamide ribotide isomerase
MVSDAWQKRFTVIPVLDLMGGVVVRGVAGRRTEYRPVVSRLTSSSAPLDIAEAFRRHFGLFLLYLADLDAISGQPPALSVYRDLQSQGFRLWVDAGIRTEDDALPLAEAGVAGIVLGLETVSGPAQLAAIWRRFGAERTVFSLDLKEGQPLGDVQCWQQPSALGIAAEAAALGVRRMIILDLARVGMGGGTGTESLCQQLHDAHPQVDLIAGGGVRHEDDLRRLAENGLWGVLVTSALHDGRLTCSDL